ncbi:receptor-like kinase [Trifolium medium]|uniref:Receptor-like kinase n=1 Tax=Trifolium medium TaxID=97028 RepID=A0A392PRS7_9FABA|nr:receptor-like kinase [Trifolium medium]
MEAMVERNLFTGYNRREAWVWRRQLRAWEEEMLVECQALLHNLFLQASSSDLWQWKSDPIRGYSIQGAYQLLTSQQLVPLDAAEDLISNKQVPLKVVYFCVETLA